MADTSRGNPPPEAEGHAQTDDAALDVELLEPFLTLVPDAAIVVDAEGAIVAVNRHAEKLFGYPSGGLVGRPVENLVPERLRSRHRHDRAAYSSSPQTRPMGAGLELTGRRHDGSEFPIDISLAPLWDADSRLVVASIRDVTDQRAATAAIAQLAAIVQSSVDAIVSVTVEGVITSWNPGAVDTFGYAVDEIVGRHLSVLVPDDCSAETEKLLEAALSGEPAEPLDTEWLREDGTRVDIALTVSPLRDSTGRSLGFSAMARDITARKRAEAELRSVLEMERRRERQQAVTAEVRLALLSEASLRDVLALICDRACELVGAAAAAVSLRQDRALQVIAGSGPAALLVGSTLRDEHSVAAQIITAGRPVRLASVARTPDADEVFVERMPLGPAMGAPVIDDGTIRGALVVGRDEGRPEFTEVDIGMIETLADQASLGLELGRAHEDRERFILVHERERIARDLHDLVIQRLFAHGLALQGMLALNPDPAAAERVETVIEGLDMTIREIRSTIFELGSSGIDSGLRAEVMKVAEDASQALGFRPTVRFVGPVDSGVPDEVATHLLAVVREALSNIARHAQSSTADVEVWVGDGMVQVVVEDTGVGYRPGDRNSGVANMRGRAEQLGGTFDVGPPRPGSDGTRVRWQAPLSP